MYSAEPDDEKHEWWMVIAGGGSVGEFMYFFDQNNDDPIFQWRLLEYATRHERMDLLQAVIDDQKDVTEFLIDRLEMLPPPPSTSLAEGTILSLILPTLSQDEIFRILRSAGRNEHVVDVINSAKPELIKQYITDLILEDRNMFSLWFLVRRYGSRTFQLNDDQLELIMQRGGNLLRVVAEIQPHQPIPDHGILFLNPNHRINGRPLWKIAQDAGNEKALEVLRQTGVPFRSF